MLNQAGNCGLRVKWPLVVVAVILTGCAHPAALEETSSTLAAEIPSETNPVVPLAAPLDVVVANSTSPFTPGMQALLQAIVNSTSSPLPVTGRRLVDGPNGRLVTGLATESRDFEVELRRSAVTTDTQVELNGSRSPMSGVLAFEGNVAGKPDMLVRLTVAPAWARGAVRDGDHTYELRIGALPTALVDDATGTPSQGDSAWMTNPLVPPPDILTCTSDPLVGGERDPRTVKPVTARGRSDDPLRTARLVIDAEPRVQQMLGNDTIAFAVFAAQEMDLVFHYEVGVRFELSLVALESEALPHRAVFLEMRDRWDAKLETPRDLVLLLDPGYAGGEGGQANCIGAAGYPEYAYATIGLDASHLDESHFLDYLLAHETGHLFNAMHADGTAHESDAGTLMFQGVVASGFNLVFGTAERSYIRGWAESHPAPA